MFNGACDFVRHELYATYIHSTSHSFISSYGTTTQFVAATFADEFSYNNVIMTMSELNILRTADAHLLQMYLTLMQLSWLKRMLAVCVHTIKFHWFQSI